MEQICYNCFSDSLDENGICTACGFDGAKNREKFPQALPLGSILFGRYIVGRVLGQGGFGITYLAQDFQTKGRVAIKEFFPDTMASRTERTTVTPYSGERGENFVYGLNSFLDEAKTMAEFIGNPNITRVDSYFEENGTGYFVMEYLEGDSLLEYIKARGGRISWEETMQVVLPVMNALEAMHEKGIIHRDVTPDNIYITKDGTVKLLDFGAARYSLGNVSRSLDVILKHGFAPKEQYSRRGRQGPYTDVYSLGATIYYAITGVRPDDAIERRDEDNTPLPTTLGAKITDAQEAVVMRALAVIPNDRYQNIPQFRAALTAAQSAPEPKPEPPKPEPPKPGPVNSPPEEWKLWKPLGIAVAAVFVVGLLLALLGSERKSIIPGSSSESSTDQFVAALYASAVEQVAGNDLFYNICGFLFDLDGDTIDELVLCYTLPEEEFAHAFNVYDVENDQLITRLEKIYIGYKDTGGSHGNIGVEYHDGIPFLITYARNGWSSSWNDMFDASYKVNLYDCHTYSLVRSIFVDVDVDVHDGGYTISYVIDGKEISEDSFRQEIQQYKRIFLDDYGSSSYVSWNYGVTGSSFEQQQTVYDLLGSLQQTAKMSPEISPTLTQKAAEDIAPVPTATSTEKQLEDKITQETVHNHSWKPATCTMPKTCTICGATSGSEVGHQWNDATYNSPKTCQMCGASEGSKKKPGSALGLRNIISSASASSVFSGDGLDGHGPEKMYDGKLNTNWTEAASGNGIGEYVTFYFDDTYAVKQFQIYIGSHFSEGVYRQNCRPKVVTLTFSDGSTECVHLEDTYDEQTVTFDQYYYTDYIKLTIDDVYMGIEYLDTVIAELDFVAYWP